MDVDVARQVVAVAREHGLILVAAGLAFYIVNALVPLLVFAVIAIAAFDWAEGILQFLGPVFGFDPAMAIEATAGTMGDSAGRRNAALIAAAVLVWSAFTMFQAVNMAVGHVYGVRAQRSHLTTLLETSMVLATVVLAVALLLGVHVVLAMVLRPATATIASVPLLMIGLFGTFVPMFLRFSPGDVSIREILPGAAFVAISWAACAVGFRLYLGISEGVEVYGAAGGVMLLLTWIYLAALALLVGVVLNAVLADRVEADDRWAIDV